MVENIDDITVTYEEDGQVVVEELDKVILTRGGWTTILFKLRQWEARKEEFGKPKFSLRRYQKSGGVFRQRSKFDISSEDQARQIVEALSKWVDEDGGEG